jgi:hypothetical protein
MSPGEKPDIEDLLTNPKYGNHLKTNVIYEHSTGTPEDNITHRPVVNHVTEEWVDKSKDDAKFKPEDVNYTLTMSNGDLQRLPSVYTKDFSTPDAEIHLMVDKTAMDKKDTNSTGTLSASIVSEDPHQDNHERRLVLDKGEPDSFYNKEEDDDWSKAFNSFGNSSSGNILDEDMKTLDPEYNELKDMAPSSFSRNIDQFTGNPNSDQMNLLGGVSENDLLNKFIQDNSSGFEDDLQDKQAFQNFEKSMSSDKKATMKVPLLI